MNTPRPQAILLLGPTGSGKTPLGKLLEARGLCGRRCAHFDFGEKLRQVAAWGQPDETVSREDIGLIRRMLETGSLLEDEDFPIAERILQSFLDRRGMDEDTVLVLNGLPRHIGQAACLARFLQVQAVICLECLPDTVLARIAANTGGDRTRRIDDDLPAIRRKLAVFAQRTSTLVDHYRTKGTRIVRLDVTAHMTAESMWAQVERLLRVR